MRLNLGRRAFAPVLAAALALGGPLPVLAQAASASWGPELIVNGDAEADVGAPSNSQVVKPTGWRTTGQFTVVQYGASGGFPDAHTPGPPNRGKNFFAGGNALLSTASQIVDLKPYAAAISAGRARFHFGGWLGGFADQTDSAAARVMFRNAAGAPLGPAVALAPVGPAERHNQTGSLYREVTGAVPAGAQSADVTMVMIRRQGEYNDGSVDNLSLKLK